jgi:hypothetical protein
MDRMKSRQLLITVFGFTAIGLLLATQGCSSSSSGGGTGGGGGTTTGTGGHGQGGSTGLGGALAGTGGSGGLQGCAASNTTVAMSTGTIADFANDAGIEIMGGVSAYGGAAAPTATTSGGVLHITENTAPAAAAQYVGTVLYFTNCVDASAFTGISYTITGTLAGCTMQYSTNDSAHGDATAGQDPKASGPANSYSPQLGVAAPFTTPISIPFAGTGAPAGGMPATAIDPSKLTGIQWQFTIAPAPEAGAPTNCAADITIDDVHFYH